MTLRRWQAPEARAIVWAYLCLASVKLVYGAWQGWSEYQTWGRDGLFEYNSRFMISAVIIGRLAFGLTPYMLFCAWTASRSRSKILAIGTGLAVAIADHYVDFYFRDSSDAQTGIAVMVMYTLLLAGIATGFSLANALIRTYLSFKARRGARVVPGRGGW